MPRTRKPKDPRNPDDPNLKATGGDAPEGEEGDTAAENRPSQLDAIRAALASSPAQEESSEEVPELPQPAEEPDIEPEPAAAAGEPEPVADSPEPPPAEDPTAPALTTPAPEPSATTSAWVPPPAYPPPAPRSSNPSSGLALGIVLVVVGIFFLIMRLLDIDLSNYGWPLLVIIPGLTLLIVGFVSLGTGALVPGGIITVAGLVLAYQNATSDWASWAFAWTLVLPGGVGIGLFLQGLRVRDPKQIRLGRNVMFWAALMFMIGFVVFESIFQISGTDYGIVGRAALPVLLIIIGVTLLARSVRSGRSA